MSTVARHNARKNLPVAADTHAELISEADKLGGVPMHRLVAAMVAVWDGLDLELKAQFLAKTAGPRTANRQPAGEPRRMKAAA